MEVEVTLGTAAAAAMKVVDPLVDQAVRVVELRAQLAILEEVDPVVHPVQAVEAAPVVGLAAVPVVDLVVDPPVVHPTKDV